jgi:hypothetical protein
MKLEDVRDDMVVRITAGGQEHPLHGRIARVILVTAPLPELPPASLRDPRMARLAHLIDSNMDDEQARIARAYRKGSLEAPFAWPHGQVELSLHSGWPFPYVVVSPDDIEAVQPGYTGQLPGNAGR